MATTKENQEKKRVKISTSSKSAHQKNDKSGEADMSQRNSSNVGKGPSGENL